jgi:hypothetical protein
MHPQILEYFPIAVRSSASNLPIQKCRNIFGNPIVVEQRIIDIEEENYRFPFCLLCFDAMPIPSRPTIGNPFLPSPPRSSRDNEVLKGHPFQFN